MYPKIKDVKPTNEEVKIFDVTPQDFSPATLYIENQSVSLYE
jgi:hypothetical protein